MEPFDLTGPLPTGTTLLEASAGTGKTYTVGALVTRYVAEGHATLDQMLVITFGRAASQELRERVRAAAGRGRARAGRTAAAVPADDRLLTWLLRRRGRAPGAPPARARRPGRLRRRHHRHDPPVLPAGARARSAWPATPTPAPRWSSPSTTWWSRSSTTSTCAASATAPSRRRSTARPR